MTTATVQINRKEEKTSKLVGTIGSVIVHIIILLILWFVVLSPADPPLDGGGMGMLMSFGDENMGGPSDIPVTEPQPQEPQPEPEQTENPVVTNETTEESVDVKQPEKVEKAEPKKSVEKPVVVQPKKTEPVRTVDQRSLLKKTTRKAEESGSGDGDIPGNEGRPDGDPNGSPDGNGQGGSGFGNGMGNGTGNGIGDGNGDGVSSFVLKGRTLSRRPEIVDNSRETGKVVMNIVVDRSGKVIKATLGKGSTTLSPILIDKARQGALDARFSAKPDGPEEQFGSMTFIFRFKQ